MVQASPQDEVQRGTVGWSKRSTRYRRKQRGKEKPGTRQPACQISDDEQAPPRTVRRRRECVGAQGDAGEIAPRG